MASILGEFPGEHIFMSGWHFQPGFEAHPLASSWRQSMKLEGSAVRIRLAIMARAWATGSGSEAATQPSAMNRASTVYCMVKPGDWKGHENAKEKRWTAKSEGKWATENWLVDSEGASRWFKYSNWPVEMDWEDSVKIQPPTCLIRVTRVFSGQSPEFSQIGIAQNFDGWLSGEIMMTRLRETKTRPLMDDDWNGEIMMTGRRETKTRPGKTGHRFTSATTVFLAVFACHCTQQMAHRVQFRWRPWRAHYEGPVLIPATDSRCHITKLDFNHNSSGKKTKQTGRKTKWMKKMNKNENERQK